MDAQKSQMIPIVLTLVAAVVGAIGQWLYKLGGNQLGQIAFYKNWQLYVGMLLFCVVMVLFVVAFKLGGRLSVVYPVYATTFIWGTALAIAVDKEPWAWGQLFGIAVVVIGVSLVAVFSPR